MYILNKGVEMSIRVKFNPEQTLEQTIATAYEAGHVFSESEIRDLVGAPTREEEDYCICGELIEQCKDGYVHMTSGC